MKLRSAFAALLAAAVPFAAAAVPPYMVADGEKISADGESTEPAYRPMTEAEFSAYVASTYGASAAAEAKIERDREAWDAARKIVSEDDYIDYGDDDDGEGNNGGEGTLTDADIAALLAAGDGDASFKAPEPGSLSGEYSRDAELAKAYAADDDGMDGKSSGAVDTVTLENTDADSNSTKTYTVEFARGFDASAHSLAGLFPAAIDNIPLMAEHDEARDKLVGWTEEWDSWEVVDRYKKKHGHLKKSKWYDVYGWVHHEVEHPGELDDFDDDTTDWDWQGLREIDGAYADEMNFDLLDWTFGGLDGSDYKWGSAGDVPVGPVIGDLKFSKDGLRFHYENELSAWGLDYDEYDGDNGGAIACLFVKDADGRWVGGKFDWISTSRTTRSFTNVFDGYNGWDLSNVPQTTEAAFVIVSRDGKWRSNVAVAQWER